MGVALIALLLVALGAGLLAIPLEVSLRYRSNTDARPRAQIVWFFGAVRREIAARPKREPTGEPKPRTRPTFQRLRELWEEGLGERVGALLSALRRVVDVRDFSLHARLGTGDPADTGMLMGAVQPLRVTFLAAFPNANFHVEPDFAEAIAEVDAHAVVRVVPLITLPPVLRFLLSPVTLRTIQVLRGTRP